MAKYKNVTNKKLYEINHVTDKTVSYSQYATWRNCQYQWYLNYAQGNYIYEPSIFTVFGTAIHNTLQSYLTKVYTVSNKKADEQDWEQFFKDDFMEEYKKQLKETQKQNTNEEIYKLKEKIESLRYGKKITQNEVIVDYKEEYYKLLNKYHRLIRLIEIDVIINNEIINEAPEKGIEDIVEDLETNQKIINTYKEEQLL
jgi:hypothetical protein